MQKPLLLPTSLAAMLCCMGAQADCRLELELMSADLHGVKLTEAQSHELAALVDEVLKRCRMGWEDSAMRYLTKARAVAGIPKRDELDFDLEPTDKQTGSDR
jgi:hypothetical protein